VHPEYRRAETLSESLPQTLTPVYPATEGMTQGRHRMRVGRALTALTQQAVPDLLPSALRSQLGMPSLHAALEFVHRPALGTHLGELAGGRHPAQRRLAFEELLAHQLSMLELRRQLRQDQAPSLSDAGEAAGHAAI
jgi:ATP-dependent DNA helicase RecG